MPVKHRVTPDTLPELLKNDAAVKVAGCDVDGILRGKIMHKNKFLKIVEEGQSFLLELSSQPNTFLNDRSND